MAMDKSARRPASQEDLRHFLFGVDSSRLRAASMPLLVALSMRSMPGSPSSSPSCLHHGPRFGASRSIQERPGASRSCSMSISQASVAHSLGPGETCPLIYPGAHGVPSSIRFFPLLALQLPLCRSVVPSLVPRG